MRLHVPVLLLATLQVGLSPCQLCGEKERSEKLIPAVVRLPPAARNPRLLALGEKMAVAYISSKRVVSRDWRVYRCEVAVQEIVEGPKTLSLNPMGAFSLPPMGSGWPEFAIRRREGYLLIAYQKLSDVGPSVFVGSARPSSRRDFVTLGQLAKVVGPESLSGACGLSFLQNGTSAEDGGVCGTDADGRLWLCTAGRGTDQGRTWDLSKPLAGYSRFHPRGLFMNRNTIALFFVDRGRRGGVRMAIVGEHSLGIWKKTSELVVDAGEAAALAVGAHGDELCLLSSRPCENGQELRLFVSSDRGKTWKLRAKVELNLKGRLCDLALLDSCSWAAGVVMGDLDGGEVQHSLFSVRLTSCESGQGRGLPR